MRGFIPLLLLFPTGVEESQEASLPLYPVPWTQEAILVDGLPTDPVWEAASWSASFMDIRGPEYPMPYLNTRFKALWNDGGLYILADIQEDHIWATLSQRDAIIYRDDDFEIFLDPDGDGLRYFEVEVNALGTILDLYLPSPYGRGGRADLSWNSPGLRVGVHYHGTLNDPSDEDRGWTVEIFLPWGDLVPPGEQGPDVSAETSPGRPHWIPGIPPHPGTEWRVNVSRVDWPLEIVPGEEEGTLAYRKAATPSRENRHPESNWVWASQGAINMHLPEKWGVMRFLGPGEEERHP